MKNKYKVRGTTLHLTDLRATLHIKEHFEMSEKDGWIRRIENDETV